MYRYGCTQFRRSRPEHQTTLYSNYGERHEIYKEKTIDQVITDLIRN